MLPIDGSQGEGGGQVLRTSLALSMVTGKAVHLTNVRAGRRKPGLQRQHLTAVRAAAQVSDASVRGAELGSQEIVFEPGPVRPGEFRFETGTAGSATLVLQTVLPPLLLAQGPSRLVLHGGTHNEAAPPFEFLQRTFVPLVNRMGPRVDLELHRHGFYPAGGGEFRATITPAPRDTAAETSGSAGRAAGMLRPLSLMERGHERRRAARILLTPQLPDSIAEREMKVLSERLDLAPEFIRVDRVETAGPGNVVLVEVEFDSVCEVFTGFGRKGLRAEVVAERVSEEVLEYLESSAPVGKHLADQLLIPLALAGKGAYRTLEPTLHTRTHIEVIREFLEIPIEVSREFSGTWRVSVGFGNQR